VQGRDEATARALLDDAHAVEAAGAYAVVVEVVPAPLGTLITERLRIPTIGIGAGAACDGQVLVWTDLAGLDDGGVPRFVRRYADLNGTLRDAFAAFAADVRSGAYPAPEHTYPMKPGIEVALRETPGDPS